MASCQRCGGEAVAVHEKTALTVAGVLGALMFVLGAIGTCLTLVPGLVVAALGLLVGMAGTRNRDLLKCTNCGFKRAF